jgi:hypothetical protein
VISIGTMRPYVPQRQRWAAHELAFVRTDVCARAHIGAGEPHLLDVGVDQIAVLRARPLTLGTQQIARWPPDARVRCTVRASLHVCGDAPDRWTNPNSLTSRAHCVPLPAPGPPVCARRVSLTVQRSSRSRHCTQHKDNGGGGLVKGRCWQGRCVGQSRGRWKGPPHRRRGRRRRSRRGTRADQHAPRTH